MHFDNHNQCLKNQWLFHDFCHFLTSSMTIPGLENKNHFPWLFQAAGTLWLGSVPAGDKFFFLGLICCTTTLNWYEDSRKMHTGDLCTHIILINFKAYILMQHFESIYLIWLLFSWKWGHTLSKNISTHWLGFDCSITVYVLTSFYGHRLFWF